LVGVVQALNQLFEKIMALDVDERHLLRMGHGEEELETEKDYSRSVCVVSQLSLSRLYIGTYHNVISTLRHRLYTNFAPRVLSCRIQEPVGSPFFAEKWP